MPEVAWVIDAITLAGAVEIERARADQAEAKLLRIRALLELWNPPPNMRTAQVVLDSIEETLRVG